MTSDSSISRLPYTITKLNGDNYHTWKSKIRLVLKELKLWTIVEGTELPPIDDDEQEAYDDRATRAFNIICMNIEDHFAEEPLACLTPKDAWEKLEEIHQGKGWENRLWLKRQFFTAKMSGNETMREFINRINSLVRQLTEMGSKVQEEDIVTVLLYGLPTSYDNLIVALASRSATDLTKVVVEARLMQEESRRKQKTDVTESALKTQYRTPKDGIGRKPSQSFNSKKMTKNGIYCTYCKKSGHTLDKCWKKAGIYDQKMAENHGDKYKANTVTANNERILMTTETDINNWYVDSGASKHMSPIREDFTDFVDLNPPYKIKTANNQVMDATGIGRVKLHLADNDPITLTDVLFVPTLASSLLSVRRLEEKGLTITFANAKCTIMKGDEVYATAIPEGNSIYRLETAYYAHATMISDKNPTSINLWHKRLGHLHAKAIQDMAQKGMVTGLENLQIEELDFCESCIMGKQHRNPIPANRKRADEVLELVHTDVWGPASIPTLGGNRYFVTFIDDQSRKIHLYVIKSKDEVQSKFEEFLAMAENHTGKKLKILRCDGGGEYISKNFKSYLRNKGIKHEITPPYTPELNGVAERANRTIVEMARSMLDQRKLERQFWGEAVTTAAYIRGYCSTKILGDITPNELWFKTKPSISHLRIFGSTAYVHIPKANRTKLDMKSKKCILIGFDSDSGIYKLYDSISKKVIRSRDVIFIEDKDQLSDDKVDIYIDPHRYSSAPNPTNTSTDESIPLAITESTSEAIPQLQESNTRRSRRSRISREEYFERLYPDSITGFAYSSNIPNSYDEPQTIEEIRQRDDYDKWEEAIRVELQAIKDNDTWTLVPLPKGRKPIGCKWVFLIKRNADGSINRYKARLVAKGYSQVAGVDYTETFAPVAKFASIRVLLAIAAIEGLDIHHMDFITAFLNSELEEEIYILQPEGYVIAGKEDFVYKLHKALYGLKQSSRAWYKKIAECFREFNFRRCTADYSIFISTTTEDKVIIAIYVDDLLILANNSRILNNIKRRLQERFAMKDLGPATYFLGIQITNNDGTIKLNQNKYIANILERFNMENCKPASTPTIPGLKLTKNNDTVNENPIRRLYQSMVGALMYVMLGTRPDIAFAVSTLGQHNANPTTQHLQAAKQVLRYLKGTAELSLNFGRVGGFVGYVDSDWGGSLDGRKSTTGFAFLLGDGAISWSSKKQATVALSSVEAEYMATTQAGKEAIWLGQLLNELGHPVEQLTPIRLYSDSQGSIDLSNNPVHHTRTKHIDIQHHFIRELIEEKKIDLQYCSTEVMLADIFTKGLSKSKVQQFRKELGLF